MKATTLQSRIEKKLYTQSGTLAQKYSEAMFLISNPEVTLHPVRWCRNRRKFSLSDHSGNIIEALQLLGIDFEQGNDAPKGGREGDYIKLSAKGKRQVKDFANANKK